MIIKQNYIFFSSFLFSFLSLLWFYSIYGDTRSRTRCIKTQLDCRLGLNKGSVVRQRIFNLGSEKPLDFNIILNLNLLYDTIFRKHLF